MKKYTYQKIRVNKDTNPIVLQLFKDRINYNPITGIISNSKTNTVYEKLGTKGYLQTISVRYDNIEYQVIPHRLCWFLYHGVFPDNNIQIDHIDGNKINNAIINLRLCTNQQNQYNTSVRGKILFKGVNSYFCKTTNKIVYASAISLNSKRYHIAKCDSAELAAHFYDAAARYYYKEFANVNFEIEYIKPMTILELRNYKKTLPSKPQLNTKWIIVQE